METDKTFVRKYIKKRLADTHKGDYGHVLIVAGGSGMAGACSFSAEAALRAGSGLVYVCTPKDNFPVLQIRVPEAICITREQAEEKLTGQKPSPGASFKNYDAVAFGPGMGTGEEARELLGCILDNYRGPLVLDADGLNLIAEDSGLRSRFISYGGDKVITPHMGEASRLIKAEGLTAEEGDVRAATGEALSAGYDTITVLKGSGTLIVGRPESGAGIMRNTTGNPGMATAGSGDVLTGVIASLAGQGLDLFAAACCAVFIHGLAGDRAAEELGEYGLIARDIIGKIPHAIRDVIA